jgi:cellobiose-specific phosphotransferase system component IIC
MSETAFILYELTLGITVIVLAFTLSHLLSKRWQEETVREIIDAVMNVVMKHAAEQKKSS